MNWLRSLALAFALALAFPLSAQAVTQIIEADCSSTGTTRPCSADPDPRPVSIFVGDVGSLQAKIGEPFESVSGMFFPGGTAGPAANFWHLRVKGAPAPNVTFGPRDNLVTAVSNELVPGGAFTAASPARVNTVMRIARAGVDLFEVRQTVLYVAPELRYRVVWEIRNIDPQNRTIAFVFGTSADLFIENDASNGIFIDGPSRFIGGMDPATRRTGGLQEVTSSQLPGEAVATPIPRWASYEEGDPFFVVSRLSGADAFTNTINPRNMDNGVGVSWDDRATSGLAPGQTARYEGIWHLSRPTPLTATPQVATKELPASHTVTLSLVGPTGAPVPNASVRFRRTGVNASGVQTVTTNAQGTAAITWTGTTPGDDTLLAWLDANDDSVQDPDERAASAKVRWVADNHVAGPPTVTPPSGVTSTVQPNPDNAEAPTFQLDREETAGAGFSECTFDERTGRNVNLAVAATLQPGGGTIGNAQLFVLDPARHNPDDLNTPLPPAALADGTAQQSNNVFSFTVPCVVNGQMWLQFTLTENAVAQTFRVPIGGLQLSDPQGVVYDGARYDLAVAGSSSPEQARAAAAIAGATVRLQRRSGDAFVDVLSGDPGITPNVNPQTTTAGGAYRWDVSPGTYRVLVSARNCRDAIGGPVDIPPPALDLHVRLDCGPAGGGASGPGGGGGAGGGSGAGADTTAPTLDALRLSPRTFGVAGGAAALAARAKGSNVVFRLSERAGVALRIARRTAGRRVGASCRRATASNRRRRPCTRWVAVGTLTRSDLAAGTNRLAFSGRLGRRRLAAGSYRMSARPTDAAGNAGAARAATFRIVAR